MKTNYAQNFKRPHKIIKKYKDIKIIDRSTAYKRGLYYLYFLDRHLFLRKPIPDRYYFFRKKFFFREIAEKEIEKFNKDYLTLFSLYSYAFFSETNLLDIRFDGFYFLTIEDFLDAKYFFFKRPFLFLNFLKIANKENFIYEYKNNRILVYQPFQNIETKKVIYALNHPYISVHVVDRYTYLRERKKFGWK